MKKNKLLLLLTGLTLVACQNGGSTNSEASSGGNVNSSNAVSSVGSQAASSLDDSKMAKFFEIYNSLGTDYYASDVYYEKVTYLNEAGERVEGFEGTPNDYQVTPTGMFNLSSLSGIALSKASGEVQGYRYGVRIPTTDEEKWAFLPSYKPANFFYSGAIYNSGAYPMTQDNYNELFSMKTISEISKLSSSGGEGVLTGKSFIEDVDNEGNRRFTTSNFYFTLAQMDAFSFTKIDGYADEFNSTWTDIFMESIDQNRSYDGIKTVITMLDFGSDILGLDIQVYVDTYDEEYPLIQRQVLPLSTLDADAKVNYDLMSEFMPENFFENGPGEESADSKAARATIKTQLQTMVDLNNFTASYTIPVSETENYSFIAKVADKYAYQMSYSTNTSGTYGYSFVPYDSVKDNKSEAGMHIYEMNYDGTNCVEDPNNSLVLSDYIKMYTENPAYKLLEDGITVEFQNQSGEVNRVNLADYLESLYTQFYSPSYMLSTQFKEEFKAIEGNTNKLDFFELYYGTDWSDLLYYYPKTGSFICSDYYVKMAIGGYFPIVSNYAASVSFELIPGIAEGSLPVATVSLYGATTDGNTAFFNYGAISYTDAGKTLLSKEFATQLNAMGRQYQVEEDTPAAN